MSTIKIAMTDPLIEEIYTGYFNYWNNLKAGYDLFEKNHIPPIVSEVNKQYAFR